MRRCAVAPVRETDNLDQVDQNWRATTTAPSTADEGSIVPLSLHWFLPTAGDSRDVVGFGPTTSRRDADLDYLSQVARVAEQVGSDAVLTRPGTFCEDAW